jgi:hypothetical protein
LEFTFFPDTVTDPEAPTDFYISSMKIVGAGDMDFDGDVDFDDIDDFVLGLNDPPQYASIFCAPARVKGDNDGDTDQDFDDIEGFVELLSGNGSTAVPEPATIVLATAAAAVVAHRRCRRRFSNPNDS